MRLIIVLAALFAAAMLALVAVERHQSTRLSHAWTISGAIENFSCLYLGACPGLHEYEMRAHMRKRVRDRVPAGFETPLRAEPAPSEERRAAAEAILQCNYDDFGRHFEPPFVTGPGLAWAEGEPPPAALVDLAEAGDAQAQWELGYGMASDRAFAGQHTMAESFAWIMRAADGGSAAAQAEAGAAFAFGEFDQDIDFARARSLLRAAVAQGEPAAMASLAILPPEDRRPLGDYAAERLDLELESARACHQDAAVLIAERLVSFGRGFEMDMDLSHAIYDRLLGLEPVRAPALEARRGGEPDVAESHPGVLDAPTPDAGSESR
jgi:hypothetical protein